MFLRLSLVLVLGELSAVTQQLPSDEPFCFEGDCYIRPEYTGRSWMEAQQMCRRYNSTLPIVDNPDRQRRFLAAVNNFHPNVNADVWLGANASYYASANWQWLDGKQYSGSAVKDSGTYTKSYAYLSKNTSQVLTIASESYNKYSYICQYGIAASDPCKNDTGRFAFIMDGHCYVKYSEKLSWFNARNNCLKANGDLASISNISLLGGIVDTDGSWIGLRHHDWIWQNSLSGLSSDVTFTSWSSDQPNDATPTCIGIDTGNFPNWRDRNCSEAGQYVCQVLNDTYATSTQEPPAPTIALSTVIDIRTEEASESPAGSRNGVNTRLAIGLGVGLGAGLIIASIAVIIVVVVLRKRGYNKTSGKSMPRKTVERQTNYQLSSEGETREIDETANVDPSTLYAPVLKNKSKHTTTNGQSRVEEASTNYASVKEVKGLELNSQENPLPTSQGPVYADLDFGQSSS